MKRGFSFPVLLLLVAGAGCTQLLGIDGEYGDQVPDASVKGGSGGVLGDASSEDATLGGAGGGKGGGGGTAGLGGAGTAGESGSGGTAGLGGAGTAGESGSGGTAGFGGAGTAGESGSGGTATGGTAGLGGAGTAGESGSGGTATGGTAGSGGTATGGTAGLGGAGTAGESGSGGTATGGTAGAGGTATGGTAGAGGTATGGTAGSGGTGTGGTAGSDAGPPVLCSNTTTLEALLACIVSAMPKTSSNGFVVPAAQELTAWQSAVASMLQGNCDFALPASLASVMTVRTFHDSNNNKDYCALWEVLDGGSDGVVDRGWGTFIVNGAATNTLFHAAPHPITDNTTEAEALGLFKQASSRGFLLAGTVRDANTASSSCQSSYQVSDVAHNTANMFQATHKALLAHYGSNPFTVIQWHGMATNTCASEVYMTHGVTTPPTSTDKVAQLRVQMLSAHSGWCIEIPGTQCTGGQACSQVSTTNTQGRLLNGVPEANVCSQSASSYSGRFLAIEQDPSFRNPLDWSPSVAALWP